MIPKQYLFTIILILFSVLLLNNCRTNSGSVHIPVKTYRGAELPNQQALLLEDENKNIYFDEVDNQTHDEKGNPYKEASYLLLMEGKHTLKLSYKEGSLYKGYYIKSNKPKSIEANFNAFHIYSVNPGSVPVFRNQPVPFNPSIVDLTEFKEFHFKKNYLSQAPDYNFDYYFSNSLSNVKCSFSVSDSKNWMINRYNLSKSNVPLIFYKISGFDVNNHYTALLINFSKFESQFNDIKHSELWLKNFLKSFYFSENSTQDISVKITASDKTTINNRDYLIFNSHISYKDIQNKYYSFEQALVYVHRLNPLELEKCVVFIIAESNFSIYSKYNKILDDDRNVLLKTISDFNYTDLLKQEIPSENK